MALLQQTSFTQAELYDRVRGDLGMRGNNLLVDDDLDRWAKEILRRAAQETQYYRRTVAVNCTADTAEYDLPTDCISIEAVAHNSLPLDPITLDDLFVYDPYWRQTTSSTPLLWYRRGFTSYALYPTPSTSITSGIQLIYTAIPALPTNVNDTFDFPQACEGLLPAYCCYRASLKDANGEGKVRVPIYQQEYLAELARLKEMVDALNESEMLVVGADLGAGSYPDQLSRAIIPAPV